MGNDVINNKNNSDVNNEKSFIQVYKSTDEVPCEIWFAPKDAQIIRPFTQIPPDPDLKNPKFDFINYKWFDLNGATQAQKLSEISDKIKNMQHELANGTASKEDINNINEQLSTLTDLVSAVAGTVDTEEGIKDE
ncbi:hypothetical protein [Lactobacillus apis]|uniref:hypothetical protein n=1 Tax=Lactobacillus apis TaxID=303541 RepID=UPI00242EC22B|nr:hypothetical protein [Lactobacillus apis]